MEKTLEAQQAPVETWTRGLALVVPGEESDPARLLVPDALAAAGLSVSFARGPDDAIARLESERPDLVVVLGSAEAPSSALEQAARSRAVPLVHIDRRDSDGQPSSSIRLFLTRAACLTKLRSLASLVRAATPAPVEVPDPQELGVGPPNERTRKLAARIAEVAASTRPAIVWGASGVGKKTVARAIHMASPRSAGPFVVLSPSELAGPEGLPAILEAHGGTLVIQRANELAPRVQGALVELAADRRIALPTGDTRTVDARLVLLLGEDPAAAARAGRVRSELVEGSVATFRVPPLAERLGEVLVLAGDFVAAEATRRGLAPPELAGDALEALLGYGWPGNVRELEAACEAAVAAAQGPIIRRSHLPEKLGGGRTEAEREAPGATTLASTLEAVERALIEGALRACRGRIDLAGTRLGVPARSFRRKLRRHALRPADFKPGFRAA